MFRVLTAGVVQGLSEFRVQHRDALVTLRTAKVMQGGALRIVFNRVAALAVDNIGDPASAYGASSTLVTTEVTATVTGGTGPFTYAWALVSHDQGNPPVPTNPSFATTAFRQGGAVLGSITNGTFICTVTDSLGATGTTTCSAIFERSDSFEHFDSPGGVAR